jgi:hypothetical protein
MLPPTKKVAAQPNKIFQRDFDADGKDEQQRVDMRYVLDLVQIFYDHTKPTATDCDTGQQISDQHEKPESFAGDPGNHDHGGMLQLSFRGDGVKPFLNDR